MLKPVMGYAEFAQEMHNEGINDVQTIRNLFSDLVAAEDSTQSKDSVDFTAIPYKRLKEIVERHDGVSYWQHFFGKKEDHAFRLIRSFRRNMAVYVVDTASYDGVSYQARSRDGRFTDRLYGLPSPSNLKLEAGETFHAVIDGRICEYQTKIDYQGTPDRRNRFVSEAVLLDASHNRTLYNGKVTVQTQHSGDINSIEASNAFFQGILPAVIAVAKIAGRIGAARRGASALPAVETPALSFFRGPAYLYGTRAEARRDIEVAKAAKPRSPGAPENASTAGKGPTLAEQMCVPDSTTRADGMPVILEGSGQEMDIADFFTMRNPWRRFDHIARPLLDNHIIGKRVLVVPGYGPNAFLFRLLGASEVCGVDADQTTVSWLRAIQQHFHHESIGDLLMATTFYPNREKAYAALETARGDIGNEITSRVRAAVRKSAPQQPLDGVKIVRASLGSHPDPQTKRVGQVCKKEDKFDFAYVPFLLGIRNGVVEDTQTREAYEDIWRVCRNGAAVMVAPFTGTMRDAARHFEAEPGKIEGLRSLLPDGKFEVEQNIYIGGDFSTAILKVVK